MPQSMMPGLGAEFDARVLRAERLRAVSDPAALAGVACVVSGRFVAWAETAAALEAASARVLAFHDPRRRVWPRRFRGLPVVRSALDRRFGGARVVFAGKPVKAWFNACARGLERCVFPVAPLDWQRRGRHSPVLEAEARAALCALYAALEDDESRELLASIVRARLEGDTGFQRISPYLEYDHPLVHAAAGDIAIDAGACVGDTASLFAWQVGPRGHVYALEPSPDVFARLERRCRRQLLRNVTPLRLGTWSAPATLRFEQRGPGSSKVSDEGTTQIEVTSVDALVRAQRLPRVDLIKMDIEGAEAEALRGAEQTIRQYRPKLQISIYHRQADLYELPELVRKMAPDYRFFLGHHSYYHMETDLYAVPRERRLPPLRSARGIYDRLYRGISRAVR